MEEYDVEEYHVEHHHVIIPSSHTPQKVSARSVCPVESEYGWVGLQTIYIITMAVRGEPMSMKLMKQNKGWRTLGRLFAS